jgi:hypothetical protein
MQRAKELRELRAKAKENNLAVPEFEVESDRLKSN